MEKIERVSKLERIKVPSGKVPLNSLRSSKCRGRLSGLRPFGFVSFENLKVSSKELHVDFSLIVKNLKGPSKKIQSVILENSKQLKGGILK